VSEPLTVEYSVHFGIKTKGRKVLQDGEQPSLPCEPGRVPRVARLLALAHRFEGLIKDGVVEDYADLARLGKVSRARLSQIMNLLLLAPAIQEELLFLPRTLRGRDAVKLADLQPIALTMDWRRQKRLWEQLRDIRQR